MRGGDERLKHTEQVVLKPQILPERLRLLADSPPTQSRPSILNLMTQAYETDLLPGNILEAIRTKCWLQEMIIAECIEEEGRRQYRENLYLPKDDKLRLCIIQEHHDTVLAGHPGQAKTFDLLDRKYYWKEMRNDVDQYVRNCHSCQRSRSSRHSTFDVVRVFPVHVKPWEDISMDFVVGLPECEGFHAIWVVVDRLSKMRHFIPCHTTLDALVLAELFLKEVVRFDGLPLTIVSDRGPQCASILWQQICS